MSTVDVRALSGQVERDSTIPQPPVRWKTRVLVPGGVLGITAALLLITAWDSLLPSTPVTVVPVMVKSVHGRSQGVTVVAAGWVEPDPFAFYVPALATGVVEEMLVLEGDSVEKGQVVARLIADDARLTLRQAEADLAFRIADVAKAQAHVDATRQILETLVDRNRAAYAAAAKRAELVAALARAQADVESEEAKRATIADELERKQKLVESGAVSRGQLRRLELSLDAQRAATEARRQQVPVIRSQLQGAQVDLDAAEEHTRLLIEERRDARVAAAGLAQAEAALERATAVRDEAQLRLDRMEVRSPVAGTVLRRLAFPGSRVLPFGGSEHSPHVVHLYDPEKLQVRVDVPLADAAAVGLAQKAEVSLEVLPDEVFHGHVVRIVHEADIQKNTVEVKVAIENPSAELKPEMLARVKFLGRAETPGTDPPTSQRLLVPSRALRGGPDGDHVLVVTQRLGDRGVVERRAVTRGEASVDGWQEVSSGLQPGDWLVDPVPLGLEAGDRVEIVGESKTGSEGGQ